ncbi:MAG TPA: arginase family protein [Solirubrobacteraceae bacterium]|nr:arginase family protein [Solirubrobacteraceae bacterium]
MLDPGRRWRHVGEKPDYAGLASFCGIPYTEDPGELVGADVAIVGAPLDELVCERPGARLGPRAIRAASAVPGVHLQAGVDPFARLRVLDYGDAAVLPAAPERSHAAIAATVGEVLAAGALPVVLGGDHSIALPDIRACAAEHGPVGLVHFDAHTDTGRECFGVALSHGTAMYELVREGAVDPERYVQVGLRGYWPGPEVFAWQRERGIRSIFMHELAERGIAAVIETVAAAVGPGPVVISVDVDVLDPGFAPGTGTPEPGGMSSLELLRACRELAAQVDVVAAEVVEVCPTAIGAADITALVAARVVHELLTGVALRAGGGRALGIQGTYGVGEMPSAPG